MNGDAIYRTAKDPHHDGRAQWGWDGTFLWHRGVGQSRWTKVNRISFTPARIQLIAELVGSKP
ncbi:hypothetical protein OCJ37_14415 [Xanthomonas sp. AM6]|uniref:hypothetical protein n=1 Tax=Xanthomonas sp. AM6 TaxID=2982531 RepID=UPI0021D9C403|nr:hypothetical protein [Xanthomonas sp. AM6]UYB51180.1 hypothetical protein OCJ37_14415 [Xanthomonas sp. AM6]